MKLPRLPRRAAHEGTDVPAAEPSSGSRPDLAGWEGHWPEDDTPPRDRDPQVPMMLNPNSPNIAPGA
jgi:hypothetical protein